MIADLIIGMLIGGAIATIGCLLGFRSATGKLEKISESRRLRKNELIVTALNKASHDLGLATDRLAGRPPYECPVCGTSDRHGYLTCYRPDCTDGRDPR